MNRIVLEFTTFFMCPLQKKKLRKRYRIALLSLLLAGISAFGLVQHYLSDIIKTSTLTFLRSSYDLEGDIQEVIPVSLSTCKFRMVRLRYRRKDSRINVRLKDLTVRVKLFNLILGRSGWLRRIEFSNPSVVCHGVTYSPKSEFIITPKKNRIMLTSTGDIAFDISSIKKGNRLNVKGNISSRRFRVAGESDIYSDGEIEANISIFNMSLARFLKTDSRFVPMLGEIRQGAITVEGNIFDIEKLVVHFDVSTRKNRFGTVTLPKGIFEGTFKQGALLVKKVYLTDSENWFLLSGSLDGLGAECSLRYQAAINRIETYLKPYVPDFLKNRIRGDVFLQGTLSGDLKAPKASVDIWSRKISFPGFTQPSFNASCRFSNGVLDKILVSMQDAQNILYAGGIINAGKENNIRITLDEFQAGRKTNPFQNKGAMVFRYTPKGIFPETAFAIVSGDCSIVCKPSEGKEGVPERFLFKNMQLSWLNRILRGDYALRGTAGGELRLSYIEDSAYSCEAACTVKGLSIKGIEYGDVKAEADFSNGLLSVESGFYDSDKLYMSVTGEIPFLKGWEYFRFRLDADRPGKRAEVVFNETDMDFLTNYISVLRESTGKLHGRIAFSGKISDPDVAGELTIQKGLFRFKGYTPAINKMSARLVLNREQIEITECSGEMGRGTVEIKGILKHRNGWPSEFKDVSISGKNVLIINDPDLILRVSAELKLAGPFNTPLLSGYLRVLRGLYMRRSFALFKHKIDIIKLRKPEGSLFSGAKLDIKVVGDKSLLARTIDVKLVGTPDLTIEGFMNKPVFRGRINFDEGFCDLFKRFNIETGSIIFSKESRIPDLNATAINETGEIQVRLNAKGKLDDITWKLESSPPYSPEDIRRYLVSNIMPDKKYETKDGTVGQGEVINVLKEMIKQRLTEPGENSFFDKFTFSAESYYTDEAVPEEKIGFTAKYRIKKFLYIRAKRDERGETNFDIVIEHRFR